MYWEAESRCCFLQQQTKHHSPVSEEQVSWSQSCGLWYLPTSPGLNHKAQWSRYYDPIHMHIQPRILICILIWFFRQLYDLGFFESRKACCGTGTIETSMLCNARSVGTCSNATQYVFWDGFHPSEAANKVIAQALLQQGFDLISWMLHHQTSFPKLVARVF